MRDHRIKTIKQERNFETIFLVYEFDASFRELDEVKNFKKKKEEEEIIPTTSLNRTGDRLSL